MRQILFLLSTLLLCASAYSQAIQNDNAHPPLPAEALSLLERARNAPGSESWAKLRGEIIHRRKNSDNMEYQIYVGIRFTPQIIFAQVLIDNKESYTISQSFTLKPPTIIKDGDSTSKIMQNVGVRPEDLTLSFMYWEPEAFLGYESFKTSSCAKIALRSPISKEKAIVMINKEHAFPLKVEWFKDGNDEALRTMEVSSFKKENDYWFVDEIILYGPGWKTKISFSETEANSSKLGIPGDLFKKPIR